jgi:hypothetical protein
MLKKITDILSYLFIRKLAIKPVWRGEKPKDIKLFKWQKMPHGYRWF